MSDHAQFPEKEEQLSTDDELKKLRKREQRTLERMQEAQKAQAKALERFQKAEARLQKRVARMQRVEDRLSTIRQQLEQYTATQTTSEEIREEEVGAGNGATGEENAGASAGTRAGTSPAPTLDDGARAVAEAAENNTRLAAERASDIAARLQQNGSARPLKQEASVLPEDIVRIEEEEEAVSAMASETIANVAAERAAKAEAIARISSAHTREARRQAQEAEQALVELQLAIRNSMLSGEEAEASLRRAENAVTRAQAFLADAEAEEERAVNAAMNAEADAEVAEGMAFAANDRAALLMDAEEHETYQGLS